MPLCGDGRALREVSDLVEEGKSQDAVADEDALKGEREAALQDLRRRTTRLMRLYGDEATAGRDEVLEEELDKEARHPASCASLSNGLSMANLLPLDASFAMGKVVAAMKKEEKEAVLKQCRGGSPSTAPSQSCSAEAGLGRGIILSGGGSDRQCAMQLQSGAGLPGKHEAISALQCQETEVEKRVASLNEQVQEAKDSLFVLQTHEQNLVEKKEKVQALRGDVKTEASLVGVGPVERLGLLLQAKWKECQELLANYRGYHLRNELLYVRERPRWKSYPKQIAEDALEASRGELASAREAWQITKELADESQHKAAQCVASMKVAREDADVQLLEHTEGSVEARWLSSEISRRISLLEVARQETHIGNAIKDRKRIERAIRTLEGQKKSKKTTNELFNARDEEKKVAANIKSLQDEVTSLQGQAAAAEKQCAALKALAARRAGHAANWEGTAEAEVERSYGSPSLFKQEFDSDDSEDENENSISGALCDYAEFDDVPSSSYMQGDASKTAIKTTTLAKSEVNKALQASEAKWRQELGRTERKCADQEMEIARLWEVIRELRMDRVDGNVSADLGENSPRGSLSSFHMVEPQPNFTGGPAAESPKEEAGPGDATAEAQGSAE
ncbi:secG [Symbiodinium natans]|uniref:SecG protein n=1 Tax=Symbiodinium natans TaxID=878477 RepID=A0A812MJQ6_9DINO|nr:secG [Symbiodinium natans]